MVRPRLPMRPTALAQASLAAIVLFTTTTAAQNSNSNSGESEAEATPTPTPSDESTAESTPTNNPTTTPTPTSPTTTDEEPESSMTFPSLSNAPIIATYPPAAVPPTINAPFMDRSTLPQGTVFIIVGAILGAFGLGILLWRGIVACLLSRSVRRAATEQYASNDKTSFPAPPAPFYKYSDHNSSLSLSGTGTARGTRRTNRGPIPSATPSQSNLFFSPTAAGGAGGAAAGTASSRDSRFLPSGFYAAGNSSPGHGPVGQHGHSISLTNLRPDSRGFSRNTMREVTPPESPQFTARREMSTSTLNLSAQAQGGRAPSAYLEDLLDENPQAFPPSTMPPQNRQRSPGPRF